MRTKAERVRRAVDSRHFTSRGQITLTEGADGSLGLIHSHMTDKIHSRGSLSPGDGRTGVPEEPEECRQLLQMSGDPNQSKHGGAVQAWCI